MKLFALGDIHGCYDALLRALRYVDLSGDNKLILLGDYVDGPPQCREVLSHLRELQGERGKERVICLRGNHEELLLDFLAGRDGGSWLPLAGEGAQAKSGSATLATVRSLMGEERYGAYAAGARDRSLEANERMVRTGILQHSGELVAWMKGLPLYHKTPTQVFVHAGVNEEAEDLWEWASDDYFCFAYPPAMGPFSLDVIAGHVGTGHLAKDAHYHDVWWDGASHFYVDGSTPTSGVVPVLVYDCATETYGCWRSQGTPDETFVTVRRR